MTHPVGLALCIIILTRKTFFLDSKAQSFWKSDLYNIYEVTPYGLPRPRMRAESWLIYLHVLHMGTGEWSIRVAKIYVCGCILFSIRIYVLQTSRNLIKIIFLIFMLCLIFSLTYFLCLQSIWNQFISEMNAYCSQLESMPCRHQEISLKACPLCDHYVMSYFFTNLLSLLPKYMESVYFRNEMTETHVGVTKLLVTNKLYFIL